MINLNVFTKAIILAGACAMCSQAVAQQVVAVLEPSAQANVPKFYIQSTRILLEENIAKTRGFRVVDRAKTDQAVSEVGYPRNRDSVLELGSQLVADIVCSSQIQMDEKGWISVTLSVVNIGSDTASNFASRPTPRDNQLGINSRIEELISQAFSAQATRSADERQARVAEDREVERVERHGHEKEGAVIEAEFLAGLPTGKYMKEYYPLGLGASIGGEIGFNRFIGMRAYAEGMFYGYLPTKTQSYPFGDISRKLSTVELGAEAVLGAVGRPGPYGFVGGGAVFETTKEEWKYSSYSLSDTEKQNATFATGGFGWRFSEDWGVSSRYTRHFGDLDELDRVDATVTFRNAPFERFGKTGPYGYASYGVMWVPYYEYSSPWSTYKTYYELQIASVGLGWRFTRNMGILTSYTWNPDETDENGIVGLSFVYRANPGGSKVSRHSAPSPSTRARREKVNDTSFRWGLQVSVLSPQEDLKTIGFGTGFAIGTVAEMPLVAGLSVRGILEYGQPGDAEIGKYVGSKVKMSVSHFAVNFDGKYELPFGLYGFVGAGRYFTSLSAKVDGHTIDSNDEVASDFVVSAGVGFRIFRHLSVEARYGLNNYQTAQGSIIWRF
ncbi:MAG: porin family protein [Holophagaceae bacterium]|nr:porin family protein [Holophagaceae bacterium]